MSRAAKVRRRTNPLTLRDLVEQIGVGAPTGASPLRVDEEAGVIFRVKVLGRFSRNNHGLTEAVNGSEYSPGCMRSALGDYEGRKVKCDHPPDRTNPGKERSIEATFGVLRNCVIESDEDGQPAIWADLHCLTSHPMYPRVVEDVKKGLGVYGLSHNAAAKRERFDRGAKRLVIEELSTVRSVDLVDKPATNRNLWESEHRPMQTSLRELLESRRKDWTKPRRLWANVLLEDDAMAPMMDAPVEAEDGGDEDDALWTGFQAAIGKILDKYKSGEMDVKAAGKAIQDYLKTHDKLTGSDEPAPPSDDVEEDEEEDDDKDKKKDAMESEELAALRGEKAARELCESMGYVPTALQVEAVAGIKDAKRRRELAESYKPADGRKPSGFKAPKSAAPGTVKPAADKKTGTRDVQESEEQRKASVVDDLATLRG